MLDFDVNVVQISSEQCWEDSQALGRNTSKVLNSYSQAADAADLIVFPELTLTGYIPLKGYDQSRKRLLALSARSAIETELARLIEATAGRRAALVVGFMEASTMRTEIYNSAAVIEDGEVRGIYRKIHLPAEENHYFVPGDEIRPIDCRIGRVAVVICYDLVFSEITRVAALRGAEILVVPSNWADIGNLKLYARVLPVARALEGQQHVVFANGVGQLKVRDRYVTLFGESSIISATGDVIARATAKEEVLRASLTSEDLDHASDTFSILRDRRPHLYKDLVASPSVFAISEGR